MSLSSEPLVTLALDLKSRMRRRPSIEEELSRTTVARHCGITPEASFKRFLSLEQKRTERSRKPFLLMLLDAEKLFQMTPREKALQRILGALSNSVRETDTTGWFRENFVVGVIFTEVNSPEDAATPAAILRRVVTELRKSLSSEEVDCIDVKLHVFPHEWDEKDPGPPTKLDIYPDLSERRNSRKAALLLKRAIDISGSLIGLLLLSPLFAVIAALIKLTSEGPVFFRQTRVGQFGKKFTFYKFRTMCVSSDPTIHKEYVKRFISGKARPKHGDECPPPAYKIVDDPRVTRIGKYLRRGSLDEFPQLFNVLRGDMSLVGPRPPLPYECDEYDLWHRRRVLEARPGITGLWQVLGRSRTQFDDMVRLDLRYARSWSLWLDLKILLKTPRAVFSGEGAY
ncbi:MAG TPA: sugar transferase [Terriglobia bacterium]|nr:sugar transferase [Terriglobia bacterium]